ncbi:hypothetical protein GCM10020331_000940 [Ectobacillus funiculus]
MPESTVLELHRLDLIDTTFLIEGGKEANGIDDLVLEVKEVRTPIPAYFSSLSKCLFGKKYEHQGERVAATQKKPCIILKTLI